MEHLMEKYLTSSHAEFQEPLPPELRIMDNQIKTKKSPLRLGLNLAPPARFSALRSRKAISLSNNEGVTIKTSAYESTNAGKPPMMGKAPVKGNGPVKLQTSRRLSSGELLVTQQANDRTLSDIKNGEYTVGRKDVNRWSNSTNKKASLSLQKPTPRALSPSQEVNSLPPTPRQFEEVGFEKSFSMDSLRGRSLARDWNMTDTVNPTHTSLLSTSRPSSQRDSRSRGNADSNGLMQALYKAENSRLAAMYAEEEAVKNMQVLPHQPVSDLSHHDANGLLLSGQEAPYIDGHFATNEWPPLHGHHGTSEKYVTETSSLYSSTAQSLMSSARSNSDSTNRTSVQTDMPASRDEVHRMIDDMRAMYLSAIESRSRTSSPKASPRVSQDTFSHSPVIAPSGMRQVQYPSESSPQSSTGLNVRKQVESKKGRRRKSSAATKAPPTIDSVRAPTVEQVAGAHGPASSQLSALSEPNLSPKHPKPSRRSQTTSGPVSAGPSAGHLNHETSPPIPGAPHHLPRRSRKVSETKSKSSRRNSLKRADSLTLGSLLGPTSSGRDTPTTTKISQKSGSMKTDRSRRSVVYLHARPEPPHSPDMPEFI